MNLKTTIDQFYREWILPLGILFLWVTPLKSSVIDWNWVPTGSMKPTILEGDLVLVNKLSYDLKIPFTTQHLAQWENPKRGDIVVFFSPRDEKRLVKRVVGLPGDEIEICHDILWINGVPQEKTEITATVKDLASTTSEPYRIFKESLGNDHHRIMNLPNRHGLSNYPKQRIPDGEYFLLGDSRDNSLDSRFLGTVARERIVGRALGVLCSLDLERWGCPRLTRTALLFDSDVHSYSPQ